MNNIQINYHFINISRNKLYSNINQFFSNKKIIIVIIIILKKKKEHNRNRNFYSEKKHK